MARSAHRAERPGALGAGNVDRLSDVLERLNTQTRQPGHGRDPLKTPSYDGKGDVNYFVQQFTEVADANGWNPAAALIHSREALKDTARDCGKAHTVAGLFTALQARFGISP